MKTKEIVLTSLFIAIGIVLPQTIHIFGGPTLGPILLPMHLPVFIGAMLLGPYKGAIIAVITVTVGVMLGMPPIYIAAYMLFELTTYALISGYLYKHLNWNIYLSFTISKIAGMFIAVLSVIIMINFFGITVPYMPVGSLAMFISGIPGIIIQILIVSPLVLLLKKELYKNEKLS